MKKSNLWKFGLVVIGIAAMLMFACGDDGGGYVYVPPYDIVGIYTFTQETGNNTLVYTWIFNEDKTYQITRSIGSTKNTGRWYVYGNEITITTDAVNAGSVNVPSITENFTISENENHVTLTFKGSISNVFASISIIETSLTIKREPACFVKFETDGGEPVPSRQVLLSGQKATQPPMVYKNGYKFDGWYKEENLINLWDFINETVSTDIILYAKWYPLEPLYVKEITGNRTVINIDGSLWALGGYNLANKVGTETDWVSVSTGDNHTVAIKEDGTLWAWGFNDYGQLGNGNITSPNNTPTQIGTEKNWAFVSAGAWHTVAIKTDGTLWAWGSGVNGQLSNGWDNKFTPTQILFSETDWAFVSAGDDYTVAIKTDGSLWAWGYNGSGQLGMGSSSSMHSNYIPTRIGTETNWASVSAGEGHTVAIKTNGSLWAWGKNNYGQLGDGTTYNRNTPTRIGTDTNWVSISVGGHTVAIKEDASLWAWGNGAGRIPTQVFIDE